MGKTASLANIGSIADSSLGFRNRIINGGMQVWQRATSQSATGYGSVDRWILNSNNTTITRSTDVPAGFRYSSQMVGTSAANAQLTHRIESLNCDDLNGQAITVSFWAKSTAGSTQLGVYLLYADAQDNFTTTTAVGLTTQNITLTSSWVQYTITFTSSAPSGVANGLQLGLFRNGTESSTTFITGVQLEKGSIATSFDYRPYGTELVLCQRYTYVWNAAEAGDAYGKIGLGFYASTTIFKGFTYFPVKMRSAPTSLTASGSINMYDGATNVTATSIAIDQATPYTLSYEVGCTGATAFRPALFQANANNTAKLIVSAEL